jgi:asparaginyl-tRNA synthetase
MIEPEIAFADLSDNAALAEALLKYTFAALLNERQEDLAFFDQRIEKGLLAKLEGIVGSEFVHMDYGEAIQVLERANEKFEFPVKWGIDLQSEQQRYLTEKYVKKPVIVMNYPKAIKAFYMRVNDDGRTVAAALASGIGEIIGGGQREERLEGLDRSMAERGIDREHYAWYREPRSRCSAQRLCTLDSRTLPGTVHRLPQIAAPLHVQPEIGAVAEYACEDERGCRRHVPAVVA